MVTQSRPKCTKGLPKTKKGMTVQVSSDPRGLIQLQMVENVHAQSRVSQRMDWIKHALHTAWPNIADSVAADGRNASCSKPGAR